MYTQALPFLISVIQHVITLESLQSQISCISYSGQTLCTLCLQRATNLIRSSFIANIQGNHGSKRFGNSTSSHLQLDELQCS